MRPPVPVLGPFRVQEQQVDTVVGERREIATAVRLTQVDAPGEARQRGVGAGEAGARVVDGRGVDAGHLTAGVAERLGEPDCREAV